MDDNKVLIVEDEQGIRELIHLYLMKHGYSTIEANNGEQALQLLSLEKPHIVLLDIEMPGLDGYSVCKHIRKSSDIPIIFLSSHRELPDKLKGFELGADDYITKPFDFEELEARIKRNLEKHRRIKLTNKRNILIFDDLSRSVHISVNPTWRLA